MAVADDVLSPLVGIPVTSPNPVLGADNKTHLPYEIVLVNMASGSVSLRKIETLDADSGAVLGTLEGDGLAQMIRLNSGAKGADLPAGGSGILFMDVTLDWSAVTPKALRHRYEIAVTNASVADPADDRDPAPLPPQAITFTGDAIEVGAPAVVIVPSLKGSRAGSWAGGAARPTAIIAVLRSRSMAASKWPSVMPLISCN
jgi:hypothetical protein